MFLIVPRSVPLWQYCLLRVFIFFFLPGGVSTFFLLTALKYITCVADQQVNKKPGLSTSCLGLIAFPPPSSEATRTSGSLRLCV